MRYRPGDAGQPCRTPDSNWKNGDTNPLANALERVLSHRIVNQNNELEPPSAAHKRRREVLETWS